MSLRNFIDCDLAISNAMRNKPSALHSEVNEYLNAAAPDIVRELYERTEGVDPRECGMIVKRLMARLQNDLLEICEGTDIDDEPLPDRGPPAGRAIY